MPNRVRVLTVPDGDRARLERRARDRGAPARVVERARIVLLAAEGLTGPQIAERVGCEVPADTHLRPRPLPSGIGYRCVELRFVNPSTCCASAGSRTPALAAAS
jgi:Homeodomain-like domain